jgi:hypothetical protein
MQKYKDVSTFKYHGATVNSIAIIEEELKKELLVEVEPTI